MKPLIVSIVSLLVGAVIGSYLWRVHAQKEETQTVRMMVQGTESADAAEAALDVRAIEAITSGDTHRAIQLLSHPVAYYYSLYGEDRGNEQRSKIRALIEELARTNQTVAARISEAEKESDYGPRERDPMAQPGGGANGSQPFSSETNQTSSAAGSRRSP